MSTRTNFNGARRARRSFLRGAAGAAVALPWLELFQPRKASAADKPPLRYVVSFMGTSLGGDGDPVPNLFVPNKVGADYDLKVATKPLGDLGVQDQVSIVSGLRVPIGGPTGYSGFHAGPVSAILTGVANSGNSTVMGTSSDEIVADAWEGQTKFRSLRFRVQVNGYAGGPYKVRDSISYRRDGGSESRKLDMEASPAAAYRALFFGFTPPANDEARAQREFEIASRRSVLDLVRGQTEPLVKRLGGADRIRMEQHLDEIRDLENRLSAVSPVLAGECKSPVDPGKDPAIGGDVAKDSNATPIFGLNAGYSGEEERAQAFTALLHMALVCDLTRVATLQYTMAQSFMNMYYILGYKTDLHQMSHFGAGRPTTTKVSEGIAWHVKHFASLIKKLHETPEGNGSVLDNCALALLPEGGHGAGQDNLFAHSCENMAVLVAGGAGGLRRGLHLQAAGKHPAMVLVSLMNAVGLPIDKLGNVNGAVAGLRG